MAVKVLDSSAGGNTGTVADGIEYAIHHGARIINLSLGAQVPGVSQSSAIPDAVADAAAAGIVVIFSAGNSDLPLADSYDGNALVVAATGPSGRLASYSQYGSGVDVAAPGGEPNGDTCTQAICVTSLYPGNQYAVAAGTSMAAPHVAGIAALLLAQQNRSRSAVLARIKNTARPLANAGSGLVDARAALGAAAAPAPKPTATQPPIIVRPKPVTPKPTKAPVVVKPTPKPSPKPSKAPVALPQPSKAPLPTLSPTPTPTPSETPVAIGLTPSRSDNEVPTPVIGLAGALIALGAVSVMSIGLRRRTP
jgi:subtilisin family serine protease